MGRRHYDRDMYDKMYDVIELIYILNRLSNNSRMDDCSKDNLISILHNMESIKSNFDNYRYKDCCYEKPNMVSKGCNDCNYNDRGTFAEKIFLFLKSLNN